MSCIGTPISWLRLEQHAAGELDAAAREGIATHLAACKVCASCLARIEADALTPLPALVLPAAPAQTASAPARVFTFRRAAPVLAALALAACIFLFLRRSGDRPGELDPLSARTKGGDVSFVLVRDDDGFVAEAGGNYRDGDRWKAVVTCPAGMNASWDLVVYERGEAAFPLSPTTTLTCGNAVPLAGAFRTTGHDRMTVCLVWNDTLIDRESVRRASPATLPRASCKTLDPAP